MNSDISLLICKHMQFETNVLCNELETQIRSEMYNIMKLKNTIKKIQESFYVVSNNLYIL